ncbi:MAG: ferredoxin--NADP+ reductase [Hyphomicrobiaceae bacterium]|jgi:ferredoxin--NADP+ reductase
MPLVTTAGFSPVPFNDEAALADATNEMFLDLAADTEAETLRGRLSDVELIQIQFGSFQDGRGFSLARRLRNIGYQGRLRARGHVISDQFRYALDCGFDDVEISAEQATRQPEADWISDRASGVSYRDRLRGRGLRSEVNDKADTLPVSVAEETGGYVSQPNVFEEQVTDVKHYTDGLFSFRITRPASFRFRSGEFAMIGLPNAEKPVFRPYSMASPSWHDELEFYSIKVPGGPLTEHLQRIVPGDTVLLGKKATGTLVVDALMPAKRLYLFSTGTGIAPFASLIRDPDVYETFEQVILTHSCRQQSELAYGHDIVEQAMADPLIGDLAKRQLVHFATTTREESARNGRITDLIETGDLFRALDLLPLNAVSDRAMICGSLPMVRDTKAKLEAAGLKEGSNNRPGDFVLERAFVD